MLERARKHLPEDSPVRPQLRETAEIAQNMLTQVRSLSQTLHPGVLEQAGLEGTIDWYLSTVERQLGIPVSYEREGAPVSVDDATGIHIYRVLQEALSNVARHSGATKAWVRLRSKGNAIEMDVEDNGAGMEPGAARRGLGIVGMRERAELLGGTLEFVRPSGRGTLVRLRVPVDHE
jgi:signal transduction histidine kinase